MHHLIIFTLLGMSVIPEGLNSQCNRIDSLKTIFTAMEINQKTQYILKDFEKDTSVIVTAIGHSARFTWMGTNKGLYRTHNRNGKTWHMTRKNSSLPDNYITSIACFPDGQTYVGTENGILFWDNYAFILITTENSALPENHITTLTPGPGESLVIGTKKCGFWKGIGHCIKAFRLIKPGVKEYHSKKKETAFGRGPGYHKLSLV